MGIGVYSKREDEIPRYIYVCMARDTPYGGPRRFVNPRAHRAEKLGFRKVSTVLKPPRNRTAKKENEQVARDIGKKSRKWDRAAAAMARGSEPAAEPRGVVF